MKKNISKKILVITTVALVATLTTIYFYRDSLFLSEPKFIRTSCIYKNFDRTNCVTDNDYFYTFKVDIDRQKVLQIAENPKFIKNKDLQKVAKITQELEHCKVFDKLNWKCDIWNMSNGNMMPAIDKGIPPTVIGGHILEGTPDSIYDFEKK